MKYLFPPLLVLMFLTGSCNKSEKVHDATGVFEATEIIVSAEANGKILKFEAEEGMELDKGQLVASIDVQSLALQRAQVEASIDAIDQKQQDATPQVNVLKQQMVAADAQVTTLRTQLEVMEKERKRLANLFKAEAATEQQLDDVEGKIKVLQKQIESAGTRKTILAKQIESARQTVAIQNRGLTSEREPLRKKIAQIDDQVERGEVRNPVKGMMLTKYAQEGEFTVTGKPLYKIADLSEMIFRAYITGDQLGSIKPGQEVKVLVDDGEKAYRSYTGTVTWIADKAEFTPKTIQTKKERANLVYAVKIKVKNDGSLKIGMYGEVDFKKES